jgi:SpoIID/LytB domain protein
VATAISATRGLVRTFRGRPILAQFGSSNGGRSAAGGLPYLVSRNDPYDATGNPRSTWRTRLTAAELARCSRSLRTVTGFAVTARDGNGQWGGRWRTVRIVGRTASGAAGSVEMTAAALRSCVPGRLPSTYATPVPPPARTAG